MGAYVLTDVKITVNAVNLSTWCTSASIKFDGDDQETTAFGGSGYKSRILGLRDYSLDLEFNQDLAASAVNQTIWPLWVAGVPVAFTLKSVSTTTTATNPEWQGSLLITEYTPLDGGVGDLAKLKVSWPGSGAPIYATS